MEILILLDSSFKRYELKYKYQLQTPNQNPYRQLGYTTVNRIWCNGETKLMTTRDSVNHCYV